MENNQSDSNKELDLSFNDKKKILQAIIYKEIFSEPKCKTRRKSRYGAKGSNR